MPLPFPLKELPEKAASKKPGFSGLAARVKKMKPRQADGLFRNRHLQAFEKIKCLECANCCKSLGPRITHNDIRRMASALKIKQSDFIATYLKTDEDNDFVFPSMPCPFLMADNYCTIYENRPKACRSYPHTDQKNIRGILSICLKNTEICPAVYVIFEQLSKQY